MTDDAPTVVLAWAAGGAARPLLDAAVAEARLRGARLLVVNASAGDRWVDNSLAGEEELAAARATLAESGVRFELRQSVGRWEPAEAVVEAARAAGAQLVVVGVRRRSPVGKLLLGSTAQRVLLDASCPVLAVKV
jgi:nucleotide-binding universal stress UspA family protein